MRKNMDLCGRSINITLMFGYIISEREKDVKIFFSFSIKNIAVGLIFSKPRANSCKMIRFEVK